MSLSSSNPGPMIARTFDGGANDLTAASVGFGE
jgi:hypothetical protein